MKSKPATPIRKHAREQASNLLRRMAYQASRTSKLADPEAVHDLRVSIRRLTQCLVVFRQFFPPGNTRKVIRKVDALMDLASQVRNRDIAQMLLRSAPIPKGSLLTVELSKQREDAARDLQASLKSWSRRDAHRKWRTRLEL